MPHILKSFKLRVFHPVVFTFNCVFYWTVVTQQCGALFMLYCNINIEPHGCVTTVQ